MMPDGQPAPIGQPPAPVVAPRHSSKLPIILAVVFGLATVGLAGLSVVTFANARMVQQSTDSAKKAAATAAAEAQKKVDDARALADNESPYRSYVAPDAFGGFTVKFPKNWNVYATQSIDQQAQLSLILNPELVRNLSGQDNAYAARVQLIKQPMDTVRRPFDTDVKSGHLKTSDVMVSGIASVRYEGKADKVHDGVVVVVPVRDKVIEFWTDDRKYLAEFNSIIAQALINP